MGYFVWINSNISNKYTYEQTEMDCDRGIIVPFFGGWGSRKRLGEICQYLQGTNSSFELSRGNTYPAVAMPWGMNFWTPQTGENRNGFIYRYAEDIIRGFRQTHQCSPWANDYAAFSLMPVSGELKVTQHNRFRHFRHEDEIAQPHYYKVTLDNRITAEMSPTERGVFMRFTYPEGKDAYVVLDLNKSHNKIKIIPEQRKVVGYTTHASQAVPQGYANYFVIVFDRLKVMAPGRPMKEKSGPGWRRKRAFL